MKRIIASFSVMCLLIICSSCTKTQEKVFRNIKWGATLEDIAKAEGKDISSFSVDEGSVFEGHKITYCKMNEIISVSKYTNVRVGYTIDNDYGLFLGIYDFNIEGYINDYTYLQQALTEKYGKPTDTDLKDTLCKYISTIKYSEHTLWTVDNTIIALAFVPYTKQLAMFYMDINYLKQLPKYVEPTADINGL